jgi:hypothetical protein
VDVLPTVVTLKATLTALVAVSVFTVGFASVPVGGVGSPSSPAASAVSQQPTELSPPRPAEQDPPQPEPITGDNVTIQNITLSNVTLTNVVVNRIVATNVSIDGTEQTVELRNASASTVQVENATIRNVTFNTTSINQSLSTDLLSNVGTGVTPDDTLPSRPLQSAGLENRTVTGLEIGTLEITGAALDNLTAEAQSEKISPNAESPELSGQGVMAEQMTVSNATVTGWSADFPDQNETQTESESRFGE